MRPRRLGITSLVVGCTTALLPLAPAAFAYERPGTLSRVNVDSVGNQSEYPNEGVLSGGSQCRLTLDSDITPDGRYIAFVSDANNLVAGDTNDACDIFVHDRKKQRTERVSIGSNGEEALGGREALRFHSSNPTISRNGRYVAFQSAAPNLVTPTSDPSAVDGNLADDVFVHDRKTGKTELLSIAAKTLPDEPDRSALSGAERPTISLSGRFVVFTSTSAELAGLDPDRILSNYAVYVRDLKTDTTSFIAPGVGQPSINADGRFVQFNTSERLVDADTNDNDDIYVYDVQEKKFELITVTVDGGSTGLSTQGGLRIGPVEVLSPGMNGAGGPRQISADGRYVAFQSASQELIPNDTNGPLNGVDVFVRDRRRNRTERVAVTSAGIEGTSVSSAPAISPDGRYVTFASVAQNLASEKCCDAGLPAAVGNPGDPDVFVYDRLSGSQKIVSVRADGSESPCATSTNTFEDWSQASAGAISAGGKFVTFSSCSAGLVAHDTNEGNEQYDLFVRSMGTYLGTGEIRTAEGRGRQLSLADSHSSPSLRYLSAIDPAGDIATSIRDADLVRARLVLRPDLGDLVAVLDLGSMKSVLPGVARTEVFFGLRFDIHGTRYEVRAQRTAVGTLLPGGAEFGLFRCAGSALCEHLTDLDGGYGSIGESISIAIPVGHLGLDQGALIETASAFSGFGSYALGAVTILDSVGIR